MLENIWLDGRENENKYKGEESERVIYYLEAGKLIDQSAFQPQLQHSQNQGWIF